MTLKQAGNRDLGLRIGVAVRHHREQHGWTQANLAERAQVAQAEISHIELGKRSKLSTLDQVSIALDKRLSDLIRFAEDIGDRESVVREARNFVREVRTRRRAMQTAEKDAARCVSEEASSYRSRRKA